MKVKYYFLTMISLMLLSFNVFALTDKECKARPWFLHPPVDALNVRPPNASSMSPYFLYQGCFYSSFTKGDGDQTVYWSADSADTNQPIVDNSGDGSKPNSTSSNDADSVGTGSGTGSGSSSSTDSPISTDLTDSQGSPSGDSSSSDSSGSSSSTGAITSTNPGMSGDSSDAFPDITPFPLTPLPSESSAEALDAQGAYQLLGEYDKCIKQLKGLSDAAYNSAIVQCNSLVDKISGSLTPNKMYSLSDSGDGIPYDFIVKSDFGSVFICTRNPDSYPELSFSSAYYLNPYYDVEGRPLSKREPIKLTPTGGHYLNMPYYGHDTSFDKFCSSVRTNAVLEYFDNMSQGDTNTSSSDSDAGNNTSSHSGVINDTPSPNSGTMAGNIVSNTGQGNSSTGDNADVVNAINSFHYDANSNSDRLSNQISNNQSKLLDKLDSNNKELINELKNNNEHNDNKDVIDAMNNNHQELMDSINKVPDAIDYDGKEGDFKANIDGEMGGLADSVGELFEEGTSFFSDALDNIDKLIPDIKLSFDLPPAIQRGSLGRCIPIVLDFDIELIGIPNYHFHGEAVQACELYDKYIRPVLDFIMVIITFFTVRGLLVRSAEFVTDSKI